LCCARASRPPSSAVGRLAISARCLPIEPPELLAHGASDGRSLDHHCDCLHRALHDEIMKMMTAMQVYYPDAEPGRGQWWSGTVVMDQHTFLAPEEAAQVLQDPWSSELWERFTIHWDEVGISCQNGSITYTSFLKECHPLQCCTFRIVYWHTR
jgi:hypothetical protein